MLKVLTPYLQQSCDVDNVGDMPSFGETITRLRIAERWTQDELAAKAGLSRSLIQKAERSLSASVSGKSYRGLAEAFGMTPSELDAQWRASKVDQQLPENPANIGDIPHLQEVPCGKMTDFDPHKMLSEDRGIASWYVPRQLVGVDDPTAFALTVVGDSMAPEYMPGDIVICSPKAPHESGMTAVFRLANDDCGMKQIIQGKDEQVELKPMNPRHNSVFVHREDIVSMSRVVGRYQRFYVPPIKAVKRT